MYLPCSIRPLASAIALLTSAATGPMDAWGFDVTACNQEVGDHEIGVLQADVVCAPNEGIALGSGSTLQLNGHAITAATTDDWQVGVACQRGRCRIEGPGSVSGFGGVGIVGYAPSRIEISGVAVHDNDVGIIAHHLKLTSVDLTANHEWAASGKKLDAIGVTASGNQGEGLTGGTLHLTDVTTSNNGIDGVHCNRLKAKRLTALGNAGFGVRASFPGQVRLIDSTVTGNTTGDIGSQRSPHLTGTACDTSRSLSATGTDLGTWGVCTAD